MIKHNQLGGIVVSHPTIYSKNNKFSSRYGEVDKNEYFVLTAKGSQCPSNKIRYYWKLISGLAPPIIDVENDGETVKFRAPEKSTTIIFELKVKDIDTGEEDTRNIVIKVT